MAKVIITGVDGNFGSYAANSILGKVDKKDLIFTSPNKDALKKYLDMGIDARYADYNNAQQLKDAFHSGDVVLLISLPFVGEKRRRLHKNAIDGAIAAGVGKIIYTSTVGAGIPENKALVKVDHEYTEDYIWSKGVRWNILRNSQYAEAMVASYDQAAGRDGVLANNHGDGEMALISRNDCAEAAACVAAGAAKDNTIYDITGPELVSMQMLVQVGNEVTGQNVIYKFIDDEQMFRHFDSLGIPRTTEGDFSKAAFPYCSEDMVSYGRAIRLGQMNKLTNHVELLTGRSPRTIREIFMDKENFKLGDRTATE